MKIENSTVSICSVVPHNKYWLIHILLIQKVNFKELISLLWRSLTFFYLLSLFSCSIGHPFLGDYVRLRQNPQWKKICVASNDQYVVFADIINKITRTGGKVRTTYKLMGWTQIKQGYIRTFYNYLDRTSSTYLYFLQIFWWFFNERT